MSRKSDAKLDATAAKLNGLIGQKAGDAVANAVLRPFRGQSPCTCGKAGCPNS